LDTIAGKLISMGQTTRFANFVAQTTYFANEIKHDDTQKGTGYYQAVRVRTGQLPEICPHRHFAAKDAIRCRDFARDGQRPR
jgi:hypothetical protein